MKNLQLNLTESDWLKLRSLNKSVTRRIKGKVPADWHISAEEIEGVVYDVIIALLAEWKQGALSPVSYCWKYAEARAYSNLMREYGRIKAQLCIDDLQNPDTEDGITHREIGRGDIPALTVDDGPALTAKMLVGEIIHRMSAEDRIIARMIMQGYTQEEIARLVGISQQGISKRMRQYAI